MLACSGFLWSGLFGVIGWTVSFGFPGGKRLEFESSLETHREDDSLAAAFSEMI